MATLTRDEVKTVAGTSRSLESIAEELLEARDRAENCEDAYDLAGVVALLRSAAGALRWLFGDLDRLNDNVRDRGELCDVCEQPEDECTCRSGDGGTCPECGCADMLCPVCGECPYCGTCHCAETDEEPDVQDPYDTEYDRN